MIRNLVFLILVMISFKGYAGGKESKESADSGQKSDTAGKTKEAPKSKSNVLDFEADVIEGERVAPNLFVQMDLGSPNMDTLMFQRKNFNDFHAIDMKRKPKYRVKGK